MLSLLTTLIACGPAFEVLPEIQGVTAAPDMDGKPGDEVVEIHLEASTTDVSWLDGETTESWAFNEQVPGPLIHAWLGQTIRVVFTNDLDEPTTIHWHGLRIDNDMDGVPAIQEPVQPGETFTYEFVPPDAGSYWYHPHVRGHEQVERGLYGTLVVQEPELPDLDADRYFILDDVALEDDGDFYDFDPAQWGMHGRGGNYLLVNGETEMLEGSVRPGGIERWRVVNTSNSRTMPIGVEGADWRVIAVDGTLLDEGYTYDEYYIVPVGRRVDLEVIPHADAEEATLQVLLPGQSEWYWAPVYTAEIEGEPGTGQQAAWPFEPLPEIRTTEQELVMEFDGVGTSTGLEWRINGKTHEDAEDFEVEGGVPTRITLRNLMGPEHPFHLHGQFFQVLERNGDDASEPGLMDTVLLSGGDEVVLYSEFENPGRWMAHCHILEHAELGMMSEVVVSEPFTPEEE